MITLKSSPASAATVARSFASPDDYTFARILAPERGKGHSTPVAALARTLDLIHRGVLLVPPCAEVLFANRAATRILSTRDGLVHSKGVLSATRPEASERLRFLIATASTRPSFEGALTVSRPSARPPYVVRVLSLPQEGREDLGRVSALVLVHDPEQCAAVRHEILISLYQLTPAEARIAALVCEGMAPQEIASLLDLSEGTVRVQLKAVFAKTDTHRQCQLAAKLLRDLGGLS